MTEAMRLLGECTKKVDQLTGQLDDTNRRLDSTLRAYETVAAERDQLEKSANESAETVSAQAHRIEELERETEDLQGQISDICRIRTLLNDAGIEGPSDIAAGTELSSRVRAALEEIEAMAQREVAMKRFLIETAGVEFKDDDTAFNVATRIIREKMGLK